jgi:hypothetical protein
MQVKARQPHQATLHSDEGGVHRGDDAAVAVAARTASAYVSPECVAAGDGRQKYISHTTRQSGR